MARQRSYRAEYLARKAKHPGLTARAAASHGTKPAPRSPADLSKATPRQAASRRRAREAISLSREHAWSLSKSARAAHTTPDNVRRWAPSAVGDRGRVKAADTETRLMPVVSTGQVYPEVAVRGSGQASLISGHLRAIRRYLATGDEAPLSHFRGVVVRGSLPNGRRVELELETDTDYLDALASMRLLDDLVVGS